jgi:hypothetical protein
MCNRDLGDLGETTFRGWCNSVGLTIHKSEKDRTGWDFLIEFPWRQDNSLPKDMLSAPIECKVQVKATDRRKKRKSITVSNLSRLVKAPIPAFYCFIEFDGKNEPEAAYLVHVDQKKIKKTLKKIRELESEGQGDNLNKHKMDISYSDENRLLGTTGKDLKDAIEKYIPDTLEKYIEDKINLLETLGFEEGKGLFKFTVSGSDPVRRMIDLTLGLCKEIYIDQSSSYHKRFDILLENTLLNSEGGILSITPKPIKATITIKEYNFSPGISFKADLYISSLNKFLPQQYIKFRIKSNFFEFIIEPFNNNVSFSFDLQSSQRSSLNELKDCLKVLTLFKKTSDPIIVEIGSDSDSSSPFSFKFNIKEDVDDFSEIYEVAEKAALICRELHILENNVIGNLDELINHSSSIDSFHNILFSDPKTIYIDFTDDAQEYQQGSRIACISSVMTMIGNHIIGCLFGVVGSLNSIDENQYRLIADEIIKGDKLVIVGEGNIDKEIVDRKFDRFEKELQKRGLATVRIQ